MSTTPFKTWLASSQGQSAYRSFESNLPHYLAGGDYLENMLKSVFEGGYNANPNVPSQEKERLFIELIVKHLLIGKAALVELQKLDPHNMLLSHQILEITVLIARLEGPG